jgi:hypothetical protein
MARALPTKGAIAAVGQSAASTSVVDLAFVDVASGARVVWTLANRAWHRHKPLLGLGGGPMPGGPVRMGSRIYLPVVDATREPWAFAVHVLNREGWSDGAWLSRGLGHAQGVVRVEGGEVWATWQENQPRDDGLFDTVMYAQKVAPVAARAIKVWAGASIGPGSVETVRGAGRRWVLYMPAAQDRKALTVAVKPLR